MLAVFVGLAVVSLGRWLLPAVAALCLYSREWLLAAVSAALWLLALALYRRLRLGRNFESPPSLL